LLEIFASVDLVDTRIGYRTENHALSLENLKFIVVMIARHTWSHKLDANAVNQ